MPSVFPQSWFSNMCKCVWKCVSGCLSVFFFFFFCLPVGDMLGCVLISSENQRQEDDDTGSCVLLTVFLRCVNLSQRLIMYGFHVQRKSSLTANQHSSPPHTLSLVFCYCRLFSYYCQKWRAAPYWNTCKILECRQNNANHWENFTTVSAETYASTVSCGKCMPFDTWQKCQPLRLWAFLTHTILYNYVPFGWPCKLNLSFWHCDLSHHVWVSVW